MRNLVRTASDYGFLMGLVFALFLAGKIVPFLLIFGVIPLITLRRVALGGPLASLIVPSVLYFFYSALLLYFRPGIEPAVARPQNPDFELYGVAVVLLITGLLRGLQIEQLYQKFERVMPPALIMSFCVLSLYMFLGIDGCRVKVAAPWPFVPALIFSTLSFLHLMGWQRKNKIQQYLALLLIALSVVVVFGYTASRGVAVGQLISLMSLYVLRFHSSIGPSLPSLPQLTGSILLGFAITVIVGFASGCDNLARWQTLPETISRGIPTTLLQKSVNSQWPTQAVPITENTEEKTNRAQMPTPHIGKEVEPNVQGSSSNDVDITLRLEMWKVSLEAVRQAPIFGHGALSLKTIIQDRFGFEHNHNQYLAWLVTGGVIFLCVGIIFLVTPALISHGLSPADRVIMTIAVTGLWGVSMLFDAFLSLKIYLHYYSLLLGFLFALVQSATTAQNYGTSR